MTLVLYSGWNPVALVVIVFIIARLINRITITTHTLPWVRHIQCRCKGRRASSIHDSSMNSDTCYIHRSCGITRNVMSTQCNVIKSNQIESLLFQTTRPIWQNTQHTSTCTLNLKTEQVLHWNPVILFLSVNTTLNIKVVFSLIFVSFLHALQQTQQVLQTDRATHASIQFAKW